MITKLEWEQESRRRENIRIDVNRFCRNVKQVLTPSERIHKLISLRRQRHMRLRIQFHVNLQITLTNSI